MLGVAVGFVMGISAPVDLLGPGLLVPPQFHKHCQTAFLLL